MDMDNSVKEEITKFLNNLEDINDPLYTLLSSKLNMEYIEIITPLRVIRNALIRNVGELKATNVLSHDLEGTALINTFDELNTFIKTVDNLTQLIERLNNEKEAMGNEREE